MSRSRGAGIRPCALGRGRHVARGGAQARSLSAEPVPPCRLPTDEPRAARHRRGRHPRRHHGHGDRVRDRAGTSAVRRSVGCPHRLLRRTETRTYCNYKGYATYWAAVVGDTVVDDVAWSYADPPPECLPIKGYLSFDAARAEVLARLPASDKRTTAAAKCDTRHSWWGDLVPYGSVTVGCGWLRLRTFSLLGHTFLQFARRREMRWATTSPMSVTSSSTCSRC
jgi:Uncharacterized protein conserved in bacteria